MREAFSALRDFFIGASYTVFAVGCVLAVLTDQTTYLTFFVSFISGILLLMLGWVRALAGRGL